MPFCSSKGSEKNLRYETLFLKLQLLENIVVSFILLMECSYFHLSRYISLILAQW